MGEPVQVDVPVPVVTERWGSDGPAVVLLHAGVCDRRSWYGTAERLAGWGRVVAYDRRGHGESPVDRGPFRHVDDLLAVLERVAGDEPAWLVGSSMGGQVAVDAALLRPDAVGGLVLLAPAVSGAPEPDGLDPDTQRLSDLLDAAYEAPDLAEVDRLMTWLWLDGPAGPEGRVRGAARELALAMNEVVLRHDAPETAGESGVDAWRRLEELTVPVTVAWGDLDVPFLVERCEQLVARVPGARRRVLAGNAHLPYLEDPARVAELVRSALPQWPGVP
jgi:pimeloyl-ACP methyl ester carboxylesterase